MPKVKVSKVEIEIGKKRIELSLDEAKELRDILNETFGKEKKAPGWPSYPIIIERPAWLNPYHRYWNVSYTCDNTISIAATTANAHTKATVR